MAEYSLDVIFPFGLIMIDELTLGVPFLLNWISRESHQMAISVPVFKPRELHSIWSQDSCLSMLELTDPVERANAH